MNTPKTQSGGSLKPVGSAPRCKQCRYPGVFIRTRYFADGIAHVWMCDHEHCTNYGLYWHTDVPNAVAQARRGKGARHGTGP